MKKRFWQLFFSVCCFAGAGKSFSQIPAHQYFYISFIKLKDPSKETSYIDLLKNYGKPVCDYLVSYKNIDGWFAYECIMPSGSDKKYDFAVVTFSNDLQSVIDDTTDIPAVFKNIFPSMNDDDLKVVFAKYDSARNIINTEVFERIASAHNAKTPPLYVKMNYMKTLPGKDSSYISLEENEWMRLHKAGMQLNLMADWELDKKLLPQNIAASYNYLSVDFFNSIDAMFDERYTKAMQTIWTNDERKKLFENTNNARVFVSSDIWKLITFSN